MGANRTLAMLNGRRLAPAGIGSSVDLNSLPQALIDRVEIITGGATTVYGSDAVAGVVNFKTRSDFDGFEAEVSAYVTGDGDSEVYDANLAWGHNFAERGNIALFGGYLERKATFTGEREFTSVQWGDVGIGRLVQLGSLAIPAGQITFPPVDLGNGPGPITFTPDGLPVEFVFPDDLYNFQPSNYLQVPLTRKYAGMFLDYDLSPRVELYVEITHTRNEGRTSIAPVPAILGPLAINLDNPVLEPETRQVFADNLFPAGNNTVLFEFWRRLEELGPRFSETHNDYSRLAAGLRGEINDRWSYDVWITVTRGEEEELLINNASASRLRQGLLVDPLTNNCFDTSNGCVPVDPFGIGRMSPDAADFLRLAPFSNLTSRDQQLVSGYVRGTPFDTWAGPASLVVGAEWRSDSGDFFADEGLSTGDVLGASGQASVDGTERVTEVYAELLLPLAEDRAFAKYLALEAGGRLSEYDHAGSLDTWKLGGVWEPFDEVRLRAMYQRSARAPNLLEAFEEQTVNRGAIVDGINGDPCSASEDPVANGNAEKCISQGIPADQIGVFEGTLFFPVDFLGGGNPGLVPETAESWTVGAVFGGDRSWTFSIDYFDMQIEDTIGNAAVGPVCFNPLNSDGALCDKVRRDAGNFNVFEIDGRILNLGDVQSRGIDVQGDYSLSLPSGWALNGAGADLDLSLVWTHMLNVRYQANPAVETLECVGVFGNPCGNVVGETFPKNRLTASARYYSGRFSAQLGWRWIEGTDSGPSRYPDQAGVNWDPLIESVGSKSYLDLSLAWEFGEHFRARLNVANVLDTDPPMMANYVFSNNTDHGLYDIFGRSFQLTLAYRQ
jgi:outer membrane receptor protein involved in Fe transport